MNEISLSQLYAKFGRRAEIVLQDYLHQLPKEKGKIRQFLIIAPLPNHDSYTRMVVSAYSFTLKDHVNLAKETFKGIVAGLTKWKTQKQRKEVPSLDQMKEALKTFPSVPKALAEISLVYVPDNPDGRTEKRDDAVKRLLSCAEQLIENGNEEFAGVLISWAETVKKIKFPPLF